MTDIASLGLTIDATSTKAATDALDDFAEAGARAEGQTKAITQAEINANYERQKAAMLYNAQAGATAAASAEVQKLLNRYDPLGTKLRSLQADFAMLNKAAQSGAAGDNDLAVDKAYKGLNEDIAKTKTLMAAAGAGGEAAGQKIGLGSAYARRELIILGREVMEGNFSRIPGTMATLAAHTGVFSASMIAIAGPIALAALAVGGLAAAFAMGQAEVEKMNNALAVTSNYAGMTRSQMRDLALDVASAGTITVGTAKDIVTALIGSGQIGAAALKAVAKLADDYAAATGKNASKVAADLVKMFDDPAKSAAELNRQMHFLSAADIERISHLQRIGELDQAQLTLAEKLAAHLPDHATKLGTLEKAWNSVRGAASGAWDAMLGLGRAKTLDQQVADAQAIVDNIQRAMTAPRRGSLAAARGPDQFAGAMADAQAALAELQAKAAIEAAKASAAGAAAATQQTNIQAMAVAEQLSTYHQIAVIKDKIVLVGKMEVENGAQAVIKAEALAKLHMQIADLQGAGATGAALQAGMDEEVKMMAEAAQLTNDFRARERAEIQAQYDWRNQAMIEAFEREEAAAIANGAELIAIEESNAAIKKAQKSAELQGQMTFLGNLAGLMNTHSRKAFEVGKIAAMSHAAVSGALAVMDAWKSGMATGGPWAPVVAAAYAGAALAYSANLINNIRQQQFGGGAGGGGSVGGAPVSTSQGSSNFTSALEQQPQVSTIQVQVIVQGNIVGNQDFVENSLIPAIKDAVDNKDFTLIGKNSRQAAELAEV